MRLHGQRIPFLYYLIMVLLIAGCTPRPDPESSAEMARVYGECTFTLNTALLGMPEIAETDERHVMIQAIVDRLVRERYSQFPWKIHTTLFDYPVPNAFTTGGGYLAAFSGVYAMADDEAALAGVIAHELSHMATVDTMEIATYLESMLALQLAQSGIEEDYDAGQALRTVVDFCLAIPGLVDPKWKDDLQTSTNTVVNTTYGDVAIPHIPYTYSNNPESPYFGPLRDPNSAARESTCNVDDRAVLDEFVVINPDYYLEQYENTASLPPIPDDLGGSVGGLPSTEILWQTQPWVQFQQTAFMRYAECQADEGSMLTLLAAGYHPLALNQSFERMLGLFEMDETLHDWRFINHPSLGQRIEDNRMFIDNNGDVLPGLSTLEGQNSGFQSYVVLSDRIAAFESQRDQARERLLGTAAERALSGQKESVAVAEAHHDFEPVTAVDLAILLMEAMSDKAVSRRETAEEGAGTSDTCQVYRQVYQRITGQAPLACHVAD